MWLYWWYIEKTIDNITAEQEKTINQDNEIEYILSNANDMVEMINLTDINIATVVQG